MKRLRSFIACIVVFGMMLTGCGSMTSESSKTGSGSSSTTTTSAASDDSIKKNSDDNLQMIFIQEHKQYINSGTYEQDISSGLPEEMQAILEDAKNDTSLDDYIVWDAVNAMLDADYEAFAKAVSLDADDQYNLIFAQLLFRDQGEDLQNLLIENVAETTLDSVDIISSVLLDLASAENSLYDIGDIDNIQTLNNQLGALEPWSSRYNEVFEELCDQLNEISSHYSVNEIIDRSNAKFADKLGSNEFVIGLGLDVIVTINEDIVSYLNYVRNGIAYLNTNDEIRQIFQDMMVLSAYYSDNEFSDVGVFYKAINAYLSSMEQYEYDQAKTFASRATDLLATISTDTAETVTKDVALFGIDCLVSIVPVVGPALVGVEDASALLQTIWDVCADTDDRAYARDMVYHCNTLATLLYDTSDYYKTELLNSDEAELAAQFQIAAYFDKTINMYKSACIIGSEYAEKYETYLYNKAKSQKKKSWHSTAINIAATQKLICSEIQCHTTDLNYSSFDIIELLTSNYWWNNIQDINVYQFNDDGTWHTVNINATYIGNPPFTVTGGQESIGDSGTYIVSGNKITMTGEKGWKATLTYTATDDVPNIAIDSNEWDFVSDVLDQYSYSGKIFYELDYERASDEDSNALWLILYEEPKSSSPEELYYKFVANSGYTNHINGYSKLGYAIQDINADDIPELIIRGYYSEDDNYHFHIYTINDAQNDVIYVDEISSWEYDPLYYSEKYNQISTFWRTSTNNNYVFYSFNGISIIQTFEVYWENDKVTQNYYYVDNSGKKKLYEHAWREEFAEDVTEWNNYVGDLTAIQFTSIN